jgi:hypothetical protein
MEKQYITYDGKDYEIKEPTIEAWTRLSSLQDWTDELEFSIMLISSITGLSVDEVKQADWHSIILTSQNLSNHLLNDGKKFVNEFEFDGQLYRFIDLANLSFGEFVDIDGYLSKSENDKKRELNLLAAMLYREVGEDNKLVKYDGENTLIRAEKFKKLPIKYMNGASSFFLRIEKILQGSLVLSFNKRFMMRMKAIWMIGKIIVLVSIGAGSVQLSKWRKKISQKFKR